MYHRRIFSNGDSGDALTISDSDETAGVVRPAFSALWCSLRAHPTRAFAFRQVLAQDSNAWASLSDERTKAEWRSFDDALAKLRALGKVGTYVRVDATTRKALADRRLVGLSAQEVQKILPEAVVEGGDGLLSLKYQDVFVLGLRATQQLTEEVISVKAENAALRDELTGMKEILEAVRSELAAVKEWRKKAEPVLA